MVIKGEALAKACLVVSCVVMLLEQPVSATQLGSLDPKVDRQKTIVGLLDAIGEEQDAIGSALDEYAIARAEFTARKMVDVIMEQYGPIREAWEMRNTLQQLRGAMDGKQEIITPFPTMELLSGEEPKNRTGEISALPSAQMFQTQTDQMREQLAAAEKGTEMINAAGERVIMIDSAAINAAKATLAESENALSAIQKVSQMEKDASKGGTDAMRHAAEKRIKAAIQAADDAVKSVDTAPSSIAEFGVAVMGLERKMAAAKARGDFFSLGNMRKRLMNMRNTLKATSRPPSGRGFGNLLSSIRSAVQNHKSKVAHQVRTAKLVAEVAQANSDANADVARQLAEDRARALSLAEQARALKKRLAEAEKRIMASKKRSQEIGDGILLKRAELRKLLKQLDSLREQNVQLQASVTMMQTSVEATASSVSGENDQSQ